MMLTGRRFAIVDDHSYWRQALVELIREKFPNDQIVFESIGGNDLIEFIQSVAPDQLPDLVILDLKMRGLDGFETAKWLFLHETGIKVITLSLIQNEITVIRLLNYGVKGFLHKNSDAEDIVKGINSVLLGEMYFSPVLNVQGSSVDIQLESLLKWKEILAKWRSLSFREKEIVRLLCSELRYDEIARQIGVNKPSLEDTTLTLYEKFGVTHRIPLVLLVHKYKLVEK
jgi:two-component system, NarL family, invasion response regulator UvrY